MITAITSTITPAIVPVVISPPVRASLPPSGGAADLELACFVGVRSSVPSEKTTCDDVVVGTVIKGSVEGIKVDGPVVLPVNECEGWLLVVVGGVVDGALVLFCVGGGVGAGASERRNNKIS